MALLFDLFILALEAVLDVGQQTDFFLALGQLVRQTGIVVVTLPVESHELVQRLLQFCFGSFQSCVLAATALQCDLEVLVHLVG